MTCKWRGIKSGPPPARPDALLASGAGAGGLGEVPLHCLISLHSECAVGGCGLLEHKLFQRLSEAVNLMSELQQIRSYVWSGFVRSARLALHKDVPVHLFRKRRAVLL